MDGLKQAPVRVERLRNFVARLKAEKLPPGNSDSIQQVVNAAIEEFQQGLEDDLNTARALAAVFDLVRDINTAIDRGQFYQADAPAVLAAMEKFDAIFALLAEDDDEKLRRLGYLQVREEFSNQEIEALIDEREAERRKRNFGRADEIRLQLAGRGIILEDAKDGSVRWKRK